MAAAAAALTLGLCLCMGMVYGVGCTGMNEWYPWGLQISLHMRSPGFSEMGRGVVPE